MDSQWHFWLIFIFSAPGVSAKLSPLSPHETAVNDSRFKIGRSEGSWRKQGGNRDPIAPQWRLHLVFACMIKDKTGAISSLLSVHCHCLIRSSFRLKQRTRHTLKLPKDRYFQSQTLSNPSLYTVACEDTTLFNRSLCCCCGWFFFGFGFVVFVSFISGVVDDDVKLFRNVLAIPLEHMGLYFLLMIFE